MKPNRFQERTKAPTQNEFRDLTVEENEQYYLSNTIF